jgi:hypothetical protein
MTDKGDSDIPSPPPERTPPVVASEITRIWEIRSKQLHEHPRYWNGTDFSLKAEEVKQFDTRAAAELELSNLRAGCYVIEVGL